MGYVPIGNFAYITDFLTLGKELLIFLPFISKLIMLIMQISTQKDNHKNRKSAATKKNYTL